MCGVAGFWLASPLDGAESAIRAMTDAIAHRGPDSSGTWSDKSAGLFLGHRRLSILDLSEAGTQPMVSASGRYILVYNGETYNHVNLRQHLKDRGVEYQWRGNSDTETLLACVESLGVENTLALLNGMFALAIWDTHARELYLARDRMGEKPLYFGTHDGTLLFASELSALRRFPGFQGRINTDSVALFLTYSNVPAPHSIYEGIYKLPPGCWVCLKSPACTPADIRQYWSLHDRILAVDASESLPISSERDASALLMAQLEKSVSSRMVSDVALGSFLSGGYDSTLVTALMQRHSDSPVRTFSIGFHEAEFNEAPFAKEVSTFLGTDHEELYVDEKQSLALVPQLSTLWDEPFSDPSQIPTYLLSAMAREHVKVALSGDGGDELFGGYSRYQRALTVWARQKKIPSWLQTVGGSSGAVVSKLLLSTARNLPLVRDSRLLPMLDLSSHVLDTLSKANSVDTYLHMLKHFKRADKLVLAAELTGEIVDRDAVARVRTMIRQMCLIDSLTYLPDTILTKVDRASMAVSLETRAPLLDHELVELAARMDDSLKIRNTSGKWILKEVTHALVPAKLLDRPKSGFGVPIESWLRGALKPWAEELLSESRLRKQGILEPTAIRRMWKEHQSGTWNWHYYLWDILMFQQWMETHHPDQ